MWYHSNTSRFLKESTCVKNVASIINIFYEGNSNYHHPLKKQYPRRQKLCPFGGWCLLIEEICLLLSWCLVVGIRIFNELVPTIFCKKILFYGWI